MKVKQSFLSIFIECKIEPFTEVPVKACGCVFLFVCFFCEGVSSESFRETFQCFVV